MSERKLQRLEKVYADAPQWAKKAVRRYLVEKGYHDKYYKQWLTNEKVTGQDMHQLYERACIGFDVRKGFFFDYAQAQKRLQTEEVETANKFGMTL